VEEALGSPVLLCVALALELVQWAGLPEFTAEALCALTVGLTEALSLTEAVEELLATVLALGDSSELPLLQVELEREGEAEPLALPALA